MSEAAARRSVWQQLVLVRLKSGPMRIDSFTDEAKEALIELGREDPPLVKIDGLNACLARSKPVPKIIWTLWLQGWDEAPDIVRASALSWRHWNQGWDVRYLDLAHVANVIPAALNRHLLQIVMSDLLRLELLRRYGGVCADATAYCLMPLERWLSDSTPRGFFAFDKPAPDRLLSNWFLAAAAESPVINAWQAKAEEYWRDRTTPDSYFWMHYLFAAIYNSNDECREIWNETPKRSADGPHAFVPYEQTLPNPPTVRMRDLVEGAEIPLLKLTHKIDHDRGVEGSTYRWLCDRELSHPSVSSIVRWDG